MGIAGLREKEKEVIMSNEFKQLLDIVRKPVESSNIDSIGYDAVLKVIQVQFRNGRVYQYDDCDQELYDGFIAAPSKGIYFNTMIKGVKQYAEVA